MYFTGLPWWAILLILGASAGVLTVLHFLRVRPRPVVLVTSLFWDRAFQRTRARTLWHRFRYPLTFLLLLLICGLISLALLRPEVFARDNNIHQVIIIDAGVSTAARDSSAGTTRLESAQKAAFKLISSLPGNAQIAVIVIDPYPRILHNFDDPPVFLPLSIRHLKPASLPGLAQNALEIARSLIPRDSQAKIAFISDQTRFDSLAISELGPEISFQYIQVGTVEDNFAIISSYFEPLAENVFMGSLSARIGYWGREKTRVRVYVHRLGGAPLLDTALDFEPSTTADIKIDDLNADGDRLVIKVQADDALQDDNVFEIKLPLRTSLRVAVQEPLPSSLDSFLRACPDIKIVAPSEAHDLLFCKQSYTLTESKPAVVLMESPESAARLQPVSVAGNSFLTEGIGFEGEFCGWGEVMQFPPDCTTLLLAGEIPVAALRETPKGNTLFLAEAFCGDDSPACRTGAFSIFMKRCIEYLVGREGLPIILSPERMIEDPVKYHALSQNAAVLVPPGSRSTSNLTDIRTEEPDFPVNHSAKMELFQWLLLAALACYFIQLFLYFRGRIS